MQVNLVVDGSVARVAIEGDFTFEAHHDFKTATIKALKEPDIKTIEVDLSKVDYLDSAALGMLLLLKERANDRKILISHCRHSVFSVLDIANFGKIFDIRSENLQQCTS